MFASRYFVGIATSLAIALPAMSQGETCSSAQPISNMYEGDFDNSLALADGPPGSCNTAGATVMQNSQWFTWSPPVEGQVRIRVVDLSPFDMIAAVYTGSCGSLTEIACADDPVPIEMFVPVNGGEQLTLAVGNRGTSSGGGMYRLEVTLMPGLQGETCNNAIEITSIPFQGTFNNDVAQADGPPGSCNTMGTATMQNSQWFAFTPTSDDQIRVEITHIGTPFNIIAGIFDGCSKGATEIACGFQPQPVRIDFVPTPGVPLKLAVGDLGVNEQGGEYLLDISYAPVVPGETCDDPIVISSLPFQGTFDNEDAQADGPPLSCNSTQAITMQNSQWFTYTPTTADTIRFEIDDPGNPFDMIVGLFDSACGSGLPELICGDFPEPIQFDYSPTPGVPLTLVVSDWGTTRGGGEYQVTITDASCLADTNHDGQLTPTDFTAWINAFNNNLPECDQNGDNACTPTDFTAWIANFNAGC